MGDLNDSYKLHLRLVANAKRVPPPLSQTSTKSGTHLLALSPSTSSLVSTSSTSAIMMSDQPSTISASTSSSSSSNVPTPSPSPPNDTTVV
jgi:hypothetical protein